MPQCLFGWGCRSEIERRRRIKLCVYAYAYEIADSPIVSDVEFDRLAYEIDKTVRTGRFDDWWIASFEPHTGSWIHTHPDLNGIKNVYEKYYRSRSK